MSIINISATSQLGNIRSNNEDMILLADTFIRNTSVTTAIDTDVDKRFVIALADGMGGHLAGEVASEVTLKNLHFYIKDLPCQLSKGDFNEAMVNWLESINSIIESMGAADSKHANMGTTLVALVYYEGRFSWLNCGDSRLYRYRDGKLTQLTKDHSLNILTGQQKHSNVVTNCIGAGCTTSFIDSCDITDDLLEGDTYMLCSDGLTDMIDDGQIASMLDCPAVDADMLCKCALDAGGFDNISVCIMRVSE